MTDQQWIPAAAEVSFCYRHLVRLRISKANYSLTEEAGAWDQLSLALDALDNLRRDAIMAAVEREVDA